MYPLHENTKCEMCRDGIELDMYTYNSYDKLAICERCKASNPHAFQRITKTDAIKASLGIDVMGLSRVNVVFLL